MTVVRSLLCVGDAEGAECGGLGKLPGLSRETKVFYGMKL